MESQKNQRKGLFDFIYVLVPTTHEGAMPTTHEGVVPRTHEGAMPTTHVMPKGLVKKIHEEDDDDDDDDDK